MKNDQKTKAQLIQEVASLRKQVEKFEELVESRTSVERIINRQLHSEIEERKKLESELYTTKQFLENIVNGITEQIILISKDFKILWANKTFLEQFGCTMEDLSGKYCYGVTHNRQSPCQPPHDTCPVTKVLETGTPIKEIHTHRGPKGEFLSEVSAYPIKNEKGEIIEFVHIARNISEVKT